MRTRTRLYFTLLTLTVSSLVYAFTLTPNMSLKVPAVGDTDYPTSISDSFTLIDAHDHTAGKGVQIPTEGIENSAVTTAKINDSAVTSAKLGANSVINGKIALSATDDSTIEVNAGVLRLKDGGITKSKLGSSNVAVSDACGTTGVFTTNLGYDDVTNCSVTLNNVVAGHPVVLQIISDLAFVAQSSLLVSLNATLGGSCFVALTKQDNTILSAERIGMPTQATPYTASQHFSINYQYIHYNPTVGTNSYKVRLASQGVDTTCQLRGIRLVAYEL